jgi:hypothetical protein
MSAAARLSIRQRNDQKLVRQQATLMDPGRAEMAMVSCAARSGIGGAGGAQLALLCS